MFLNFSKPIQVLPYIYLARLHRPIGIWLLLWPCFIGLSISHGNFLDYLLFFIGAIITRSAGCIINDIVDINIDKKVTRTKSRPLTSNQINKTQAITVTLLLLLISFFLWLFLSHSAKCISILALSMMVIYPFMKRITYWPQIFLGFTFNIGLLIAIAHISILIFSWELTSLFFSLVLWTIFYDTIYAFADLKDDLKINVKSTAMIMHKHPKIWLSSINFLMHILFFMFNGLSASLAGALYLQVLLAQWQPNDQKNSIKIFTHCHFWGLIEWFLLELVRIISP